MRRRNRTKTTPAYEVEFFGLMGVQTSMSTAIRRLNHHDIDVLPLANEPQTPEVEVFGQMSVQTTKMPLILFDLRAIVNFRCFSLLKLVKEKEESAVFKTTTNPTSRARYLKREQ